MLVAFAFGAVLVGVRNDRGLSAPVEPIEELKISGSRAMSGPVGDWLELYRDRYPAVRAHAAMFGTGPALGALSTHRAEVVPMSREMLVSEESMLADSVRPIGIKVGDRQVSAGRNEPLFIYLSRRRNGAIGQDALNFVDVAISEKGQASLASAGFRPLTRRDRASARERLALLLATTNPPHDQDGTY